MSIALDGEAQVIPPRSLSDREGGWIYEILQTREEWKDADISRTKVAAEGPCDEGISIMLSAPTPEQPKAELDAGYIGRIWITNADDSVIEVRLTHSHGRLHELFVLFVDPRHPRKVLPESWTEVSHDALAL